MWRCIPCSRATPARSQAASTHCAVTKQAGSWGQERDPVAALKQTKNKLWREAKCTKHQSFRTTFGGSDVAALHHTKLHYIPLHYATLHSTTLHYNTLHYLPLHFTTLHYTPRHYNYNYYYNNYCNYTTTLHYNTLHYAPLH